jgi:hypothetical protein
MRRARHVTAGSEDQSNHRRLAALIPEAIQ